MTNEKAVTQEVEDIVKSPEYEVVDEKAFQKAKTKILEKYKHVFEELAKWLNLHWNKLLNYIMIS